MPNLPDLQGNVTGLLRSPKTILGFLAILVGLVAATLVLVLRLATDNLALQAFIPHILAFGAGVLLFVLLAVFVTAWINPTKLMLGEVKGEVYLQMLRLKQGDSLAGDIVENVPAVVTPGQQIVPLAGQPKGSTENSAGG